MSRRAFERALRRAPIDRTEKGRPDRHARAYRYERLVTVSIRNTYYNLSGDRCPDFEVRPTAATALCMRSHGLLFRPERFGFTVLYLRSQRRNLLQWLRRQRYEEPTDRKPVRGEPKPGEVWSRLTFLLSLGEPDFLNVTAVPVDLNPSESNYFLSNQTAHHDGGQLRLTPGRWVTGTRPRDVVPSHFEVPTPEGVRQVWLRSLSGERLRCWPRCVPPAVLDRRGPSVRCRELDADVVEEGLDPNLVECRDELYVDLAGLPEDRYTLEWVGYGPGSLPEELREPWTVVYTSLSPMPLCMVDLLFTDPRATPEDPFPDPEEGVYPVVGLWAGDLEEESTGDGGEEASAGTRRPRIVPRHYEMDFPHRATTWNYFVVPRPADRRLEDLRIRREDGGPAPFSGPHRTRLADGSRAFRFTSTERLPLFQRVPEGERFTLWGVDADLRSDAEPTCLVSPLPGASPLQILPANRDGSEPFQRQAVKRLSSDPHLHTNSHARDESPASSPRRSAEGETEPDGGTENPVEVFSDIFVYV